MKRISISILLAIFCTTQIVASDDSRLYLSPGLDGRVVVDLNESTGIFIIEIRYQLARGIKGSCVLSSGYFKHLSDNEITFEDAVTGVTMKTTKDEYGFLTFVSAYNILKNRVFIPVGHGWPELKEDFNSPVLTGSYSAVVNKRTRLTKGSYTALPSRGTWRHGGLSLAINGSRFTYKIEDGEKPPPMAAPRPSIMTQPSTEDFTMELPAEFIDVSLLQGTWSQDGNLITLHDEHTGHDFYLIYEYPNLRTMLQPGDWSLDGTVLTPR
jgi:hypothetical protein